MPRWSAERRNVPIARDVGRLESVRACVSARNGASQAPSAVSALRSPSLGGEGPPHYGAPGAAKQTGGGALAMPMRTRAGDAPGTCPRIPASGMLSTSANPKRAVDSHAKPRGFAAGWRLQPVTGSPILALAGEAELAMPLNSNGVLR